MSGCGLEEDPRETGRRLVYCAFLWRFAICDPPVPGVAPPPRARGLDRSAAAVDVARPPCHGRSGSLRGARWAVNRPRRSWNAVTFNSLSSPSRSFLAVSSSKSGSSPAHRPSQGMPNCRSPPRSKRPALREHSARRTSPRRAPRPMAPLMPPPTGPHRPRKPPRAPVMPSGRSIRRAPRRCSSRSPAAVLPWSGSSWRASAITIRMTGADRWGTLLLHQWQGDAGSASSV